MGGASVAFPSSPAPGPPPKSSTPPVNRSRLVLQSRFLQPGARPLGEGEQGRPLAVLRFSIACDRTPRDEVSLASLGIAPEALLIAGLSLREPVTNLLDEYTGLTTGEA